MAITYPIDCDTPRKRTEWLYRAQEKLRNIHNGMYVIKQYGITAQQWQNGINLSAFEECHGDETVVMPDILKAKYYPDYVIEDPPGTFRISEETMQMFIKEDFTPRQMRIGDQVCIQRALLKISAVWDMDAGEI